MPGVEALPFGAEIAAAALGLLVAILGLIARSIARSEKVHVDPVREDLAAIQTRIEQHDRQAAQRAQSLSENLIREIRESEDKNRRQFERLIDRLDGRDSRG